MSDQKLTLSVREAASDEPWGEEMDDDSECPTCGGDGWMFGGELDDPFWYEPNKLYPCENCGGTGNAADCTVW